MKEIKTTKYQCEKCGATYDTEEAARKCEAAHMDPLCVFEMKYKQGQAHPECIVVGLASGIRAHYYFAGTDDEGGKR